MSTATQQQDIEVRLDREALNARLIIRSSADPAFVTPDACAMQLRGAGVQVTKPLQNQVDELVRDFQQQPDRGAELEIHGHPPEHGQAGRFEWDPECDPEREEQKADENESVDFYQQTGFTTVAEGQVLGRIVPPTNGTSGLSLRGDPIPARPGKTCDVKPDPASVLVGPDGRCTSLISGVLHAEGPRIWVSPQLEVNGYVDFNTGHITFKGDVTIRKGVRDLFCVSATGDVTVHQLIEAARFNVGGSLAASGGIAAKGRGTVEVGHDLTARYLDNVNGHVSHDVRVEREMIQCRLSIGGDLVVDRGALIGGVNRVGGLAHIGEIGSRAHLRTTVVLGVMPDMDRMLAKLEDHLQQLTDQRDRIEQEINQCASTMAHNPDQKKRLAELMQQGPALDQRIDAIERKADLLRKRYEEQRRVDLRVERAAHCGTVIQVDRQQLIFIESVHTRLRLSWTRGRRLMMAVGSGNLTPIDRWPMIKLANAEAT